MLGFAMRSVLPYRPIRCGVVMAEIPNIMAE